MSTTAPLFRRISLVGWLAALLLAAATAAAQTIEGRMVEAGTGEAVAGASVMLLDASGRRIDFALTDAEGRFRLRAPAAGRFRLSFERIGYEGSESGAFDLAAGEVSRRRLEVPVRPLALPPIKAVTRRRCVVRPAEGEAASRIWDEVRKALEATVWTERRSALRYTLIAWDRRLHPQSLEILDERVRRVEGTSRASPWVADEPGRLVREGFVRPDGDGYLYYGPDAATILSDAFLDSHCFRAVPAPEDQPGWIGLAFDPERGADVVAVRGVLWVDRESSELRRLDFDYSGLPPDLRFDVAGGRVEFERVATGEWIVKRWWIRMPIVGVPRRTVVSSMRMDAAARSRPRLLEVEEDGGEVVSARATRRTAFGAGETVRVVWSEPIPFEAGEEPAPVDRDPLGGLAEQPVPAGTPRGPAVAAEAPRTPVPPGVLVQAVDVGTGEPIDGVQISVRGSGDGGSTGVDGRVALGPLRVGRQVIELERLGYVPFETVVEVPPDGWRRYRVEVHPMPILAEAIEATIEPDRIQRAIGEARYRLTAEQIPDHTPLSVPELIAYRLPGLHYIRKTGGQAPREGAPALSRVCSSFESRNGTVQLFIIDGIRYQDACVVETLVPGEIEEIAVIISYAGQTEFGRPGGGVVIIRTKRGWERQR